MVVAGVMRDPGTLTDVCIWQIYNRVAGRASYPQTGDLQTGMQLMLPSEIRPRFTIHGDH